MVFVEAFEFQDEVFLPFRRKLVTFSYGDVWSETKKFDGFL